MEPKERKRLDYNEILAGEPIPPTRSESDEKQRPWDLELLVRQVVAKIILDRSLSEKKLASMAGVDQKTINRFMNGEGMRLDTLARICAGLETTPIRLIESHPGVGRGRPDIRIARDKVFDRFRRLGSQAEQEELISLMEEIGNLHLYSFVLSTLRGIVNSSKIGRKQGLREKRARYKAKSP